MRYTSMFMTKSRFYSDHSFAHIVHCTVYTHTHCFSISEKTSDEIVMTT